jgi:uncharacterized lipoprotein YddW (UPF0748 family)
VVHVEKTMVRQSLIVRRAWLASLGACALVVSSCSTMDSLPSESNGVSTNEPIRRCASSSSLPDCPPPSPREFRAVWIATVANIDWPTKPGLSASAQRAEAISILNRVQSLNMNAVLLQVRPSADAIYPSTLEPWTEWLSGEQGRASADSGSGANVYDPLAFWIAESKKRGIELHAWFNPYRARHTKATSPISKDHIANRAPNAVKPYGGFLWLDPGEKAAQDHSFAVIMDVLRRYDIDGVHFDDYFYPYPVVEQAGTQQPSAASNAVSNALNQSSPSMVNRTPERDVDFPDEPSWRAYVASGGRLARADWRRDNVNRFVERIYKSVKAEKPWVRFGISPFGIGRPDRRPPGIVGFSQYDKLYADVELWLQRGWLDYLAPQLYWSIDQTPQAFGTLLNYWHSQNPLKRDIFPGLYTSRIDDTPRSWEAKEIENQIEMIRAKQGVAQGHIHFSMAPIAQNRRQISETLNRQYAFPALPMIAQLNGALKHNTNTIDIKLKVADSNNFLGVDINSFNVDSMIGSVALHVRYGSTWQFATLPPNSSTTALQVSTTVPIANANGKLNAVAASLVDRYGRETDRFVRDVNAAGTQAQ